MACALTQGYTLDCRDNAGGAKAFWLIEFANVSGVTSSAGVVSVIGKANNKRFWKYEQIRGNAEAKEDIESNEGNGVVVYNQAVTLILTKMQASLRNEIILLAQNYLIMVVQDRNDKYWLYGWPEGMILATGGAGTGKAGTDLNGYTLNFTGQQPALALEVESSVIAGLTTP